jgi:hypothetical protein
LNGRKRKNSDQKSGFRDRLRLLNSEPMLR